MKERKKLLGPYFLMKKRKGKERKGKERRKGRK